MHTWFLALADMRVAAMATTIGVQVRSVRIDVSVSGSIRLRLWLLLAAAPSTDA
jgi:hypothetical protein